MSLISKAERIFGRFSIPNLSLYLIAGQLAVFLAIQFGKLDPTAVLLVPRFVLSGQWWRMFAFLLNPPDQSIWFIGFAWWIFYLMGNALEHFWGTFRYNVFIFLGSALTVGLSFLTPDHSVSNAFIAGSVFLAFAHLNPDFELSLYFILPVKIKWLALVTWVLYALQFIFGSWALRFQVIASVGNFLIFFGEDIVLTARYRRRQMIRTAKQIEDDDPKPQSRHRCRICGKTEITNPEMDFRYCSKCAGDECYCPDHIRNHEHVQGSPGGGSQG
jgi:hypothetical protein